MIGTPATAQPSNRITIVADAFGRATGLEHDWGYSALVEYSGFRILFDTVNDSAKFASNVAALGVDLEDLDAVVISHRHGDHTDGLHHLRTVNPDVVVYGPSDEYFGGATPAAFFRRLDASLAEEQRYFGGRIPSEIPHGTPWRGLNLVRGAGDTEIAPGIRLVENIAPGADFGETPELTLVIDAPGGQVVLVGCSHPGIERILASLGAPARPVRLLTGGLHLLTTPDPGVDLLAEKASNGVGRAAYRSRPLQRRVHVRCPASCVWGGVHPRRSGRSDSLVTESFYLSPM